MKRFILLAAVSALVIARPETYKEQEDFQYSRSSSDDGTKSGYYGAQRGNMGGNYERAHNMDGLAQHQMSGLVRQVNGDLGDGIKTRSGSVYSAANSRGTYGSGSYDLSNLAGRNFQEGTFSDNSQLGSAQYSSSAHNSAGYASSTSQNYGSNRKIANDAQIQTDNLQSLDNMHSSNQHSYGSSRRSSGYSSQAGFQEHSQYNSDSANSNSGYGSTQYTRLTPVRIIVKPGGRVAIPVGAQVYDANQGSAVINHNALSSDDESAGEVNQGSVNRPSNNKYYESSYRYHTKWEKHATIPPPIVVYPTESLIPKNSELYEDLDVHRSNYQNNARGADDQNAHLSTASGRYNAAQASSQSRYQSNYNSQQSTGASNSNAFTRSGYNSHLNRGVSSDSSNAYTEVQHNSGSRYYGVSADSNLNTQTRHKADAQLDLNDQVESLNNRPKSYQSSYSYHKSWERQGDPYVIKPASNGYYDSQASQRLASSTKSLGYTTYQPSSNCDEKCHIRIARSYGTDNQDLEQQQSRNTVDDQHVQSTNLEELSQQSQNTNEQQVQNQWDNLKDLSQQSQNTWDQQNVGQQSQINWDNSKDLTQQSQTNWDQQNVGQQSQTNWDNLKDLTQQSQTNWDQQSVGQQSQNRWDNLEDLGQQSQTNWNQQNVRQQTQTQWDRLEDLGHQSKQDVPQQTEHQESNSQDLSQQSQINWDQQNERQQSQNHWDNLEDLGQQSQRNWDQSNVGQQSNSNWDKIEKLNQSSLKNWGTLDVGQHSLDQNKWDQQDSDNLGQRAQNNQDNKPQDDLYAQYDHKLEVIRPNIQLEHPQPSNEKENNKKVDNLNSNKSETIFAQQNTDYKTGFESFSNKNSMDQKITDDVLLRQVLQSHKMNFNNKDDAWPSQKDSIDNTDYSYSSGFVNPFFYHKTQLANNENTYAANSPEFESIWNSHMHTNSHSQVNWHIINKSQSNTDVQQTSLSNLWLKIDKIDTGSGFSYMNHTDLFPKTNQTNSNFTLLANRDIVSEIQPWYVIDTTNISKANTEINTALTKQENHKDESHSKSTYSTQTYRESKDSPNNINASLNSDKPETSQDIGRGDIGPDDSIDINGTNNPYNNPISTILISQNTVNDPIKHDKAKPIANNTHTSIKQGVPEDHLTVLGLEQQNKDTYNDSNIVVTYKNDTTHNILQSDDNEIKQSQNLNENKVENQSYSDHQTKYFEIQTDISTQSSTNTQNYSQHDVESQNTINFDQESINIEQENAYNFGQDSSQETLRSTNVEQQHLHNFRQEQVPDARQKNRNIEQHTNGHENMLNLGRQNKNISLLNEILFNQESVQDIKKKNENSLQQYFKPEYDNVIKTNLSRVQKSVHASNLDKNDDHLFQNFGQQIQSEINYGADYEPQINSYEQEFDQDFYMQYQSHSKNFSQESEKQQNKHITQETHTSQIDLQDHLVSTIPTSTVETGHSIYSQIFRPPVTPKPSFWTTVGNKFTSAKNTIVSWFKS